MTKDEALRMALEALEKLFGIPDMLTGENSGDVAVWRLGGSYRTQQAITAIKEALAQPKEWVGLMRGIRVEGDTVVIAVKGGNDEARCLCGELIKEMEMRRVNE